jgi:hypothetical protein
MPLEKKQIRYPLYTRQDFEDDSQWSAFERYRNLPPVMRTPEGVAGIYPIVSLATYEIWEKKFFWRERAAEYDRKLDIETVEAKVKDVTIASVRRDALDTVMSMHKLLNGEIKVYLAKQAKLAQDGANVELLKPHEMIRALREVVLLGRLLMGESTENVSMAFDVSKLTDTELAFLSDIQRRMNAPLPPTREVLEAHGVEKSLDIDEGIG